MKLNFSNTMIIIIFIGLIFVSYQWAKYSVKCPQPKIVYKYIPRDFNVDSTYPDLVSSNFNDMFTKPTPYIVPLGSENLRKTI